MKKLLIAQFVLLLSLYVSAQQDMVIKGTKPVDKKLTPQQVQDSLMAHFPNATAVKYYKASPDVTNRGWTITTEDNLEGSEADYYTISFKQEGLQYYALHDHNGQLLECKVQQKVDQLPDPVVTSLKAIKKDYPGYKVIDKTYFKQQNYSKSKEYYEVTASNGNQTKKFYYSADGKLQKVK